MERNKEFYLPGDTVTIRQDIPNKPTMLVVKKSTKTIITNNNKDIFFQGILCRWFTTNGEVQECTFNTKDLIKV
jgi:uncharacterized protein YodC (DUF2158 family)